MPLPPRPSLSVGVPVSKSVFRLPAPPNNCSFTVGLLPLTLMLGGVMLLNNIVGDTWIAATLSVRTVEWYKVLVPVPYVALMAAIHARRTAGPRWFEAAMVAALLWPLSTVFVDFLHARLTSGIDPEAFLDRFGFWWGAPYPLLVLTLFAAPLLAGLVVARRP